MQRRRREKESEVCVDPETHEIEHARDDQRADADRARGNRFGREDRIPLRDRHLEHEQRFRDRAREHEADVDPDLLLDRQRIDARKKSGDDQHRRHDRKADPRKTPEPGIQRMRERHVLPAHRFGDELDRSDVETTDGHRHRDRDHPDQVRIDTVRVGAETARDQNRVEEARDERDVVRESEPLDGAERGLCLSEAHGAGRKPSIGILPRGKAH